MAATARTHKSDLFLLYLSFLRHSLDVPDDHDPNQVEDPLKIHASVAAQLLLIMVDFLVHANKKLYVTIANWKFLCYRLSVRENSCEANF
jgi:hypothetical protein